MKDKITNNPVVAFVITFFIISMATLVSSAIWTSTSFEGIISAQGIDADAARYSNFGQLFSGTIGSAIALAGAFVGIILASTAYLLAKREHLRDEVIFLDEKIVPALETIVIINKFWIEHFSREKQGSLKCWIRDEKSFLCELRNQLDTLKGNKWAIYLLLANEETRNWYQALKDITDNFEQHFEINFHIDEFKGNDKKIHYKFHMNIINHIERVQKYIPTTSTLRACVGYFVPTTDRVLEIIIQSIVGKDISLSSLFVPNNVNCSGSLMLNVDEFDWSLIDQFGINLPEIKEEFLRKLDDHHGFDLTFNEPSSISYQLKELILMDLNKDRTESLLIQKNVMNELGQI